ncbi:unnamed protein product [Closterium sp. Yama58-4]|nr:unnamed protein product [Closterium sp. Yama58-4]
MAAPFSAILNGEPPRLLTELLSRRAACVPEAIPRTRDANPRATAGPSAEASHSGPPARQAAVRQAVAAPAKKVPCRRTEPPFIKPLGPQVTATARELQSPVRPHH